MAFSIQLRRDTSANWTSINPVLLNGEPGFETDTNKLKIGDGTTNWNTLAYVVPTITIPPAIPAGSVTPFAGSVAPSGWLMCNGSAVSRTTYADLFAVIGTTYGVGDNSTTFNLPDMRGRVIAGFDNSQTEFNAVGKTGGEKSVSLTESQMPRHTHIQNAHTHTQDEHTHSAFDYGHTHNTNTRGDDGSTLTGTTNTYRFTSIGSGTLDTAIGYASIGVFGATATNQNTTATNQFTGGVGTAQSASSGAAHNNLQPFISLNYMIKT